jgi:hypothetical protein
MRIERWISGILHALGDDSTQEDAEYVVTNRIGFVPIANKDFKINHHGTMGRNALVEGEQDERRSGVEVRVIEQG